MTVYERAQPQLAADLERFSCYLQSLLDKANVITSVMTMAPEPEKKGQ